MYKCQCAATGTADNNDDDDDETLCVVVRLIGGNVLPHDAPIRSHNETSETLVFYGLGHAGLGPKLHALFPGGRIEEFIQSRTMTVEEWLSDPVVNVEIAKITANFHSMKLPISKKPWNIREIVEKNLKKFNEQRAELEAEGYIVPQVLSVIEFDFESELNFIESIVNKINSRVVFSSNDANRSNFLVKTNNDGSYIQPLKLVQVDVEFSSYNYRAFDIGNYFGMKTFDFGAAKLLTGQRYPSEEYRRQFIQAYIEVMNQIGLPGDWDGDGRDSLEHILLEVDFGSFAVRTINLSWLLRDLKIWVDLWKSRLSKDPSAEFDFGLSIAPYYYERKKDFLTRHKEWLENNVNGELLRK